MEPRGHRLQRHKVLSGILGVGCVVGTLYGVLSGLFLLALAQAFFAAAMALIYFEAESKGAFFDYLTWVCLGIGILATAAAAAV